jgi:hypothetical protein
MRPFWVVIPRPIREEKTPRFKPISLKEHQMGENHIRELNTYLIYIFNIHNVKINLTESYITV